MSELDALLSAIPFDQLGAALGEDPNDLVNASAALLPALIGGMQANAQDPLGALSLLDALNQHDDSLADNPAGFDRIDLSDGEKIAGHVFGANQDQVLNQLGAYSGASGSLLRKLLPILAPIVLSILAKKLRQNRAAGGGSGAMMAILEQLLAGAAQGTGGRSQMNSGSILADVLGGLLGDGRR